ncbi:hypothetical protein EMMF5_005176 [Cystobasidiomycetes sp. EMM_F5]
MLSSLAIAAVATLGAQLFGSAEALGVNCLSSALVCPALSLVNGVVSSAGLANTGNALFGANGLTCNYGSNLALIQCNYDANGALQVNALTSTALLCAQNIKTCTSCPAGNALQAGDCVPCTGGLYALAGNTGGTFAVVNGILPCQACPAGFVPTADRSSCVAIAPTGCLTTTSACPAVDAAGNAYNAGLSSIFAANNQLSCVYGAAGLNTCIYGLNSGILTGTSLNNNLCLSTAVTVCASCPAGFALNNLACTACAAGQVAGVGVNGPHWHQPSGYLFGEKPGNGPRVKEDWENLYVYGMFGGMAFITVLLMYKPDTSVQTWATSEAKKKLEQAGGIPKWEKTT